MRIKNILVKFFCFVFLVFCFFSKKSLSKSPKVSLSSKLKIYKTIISLPKELNFKNYEIKKENQAKIINPFSFQGVMVFDTAYISENYVDAIILHQIYYETLVEPVFDEEKLKKENIKILNKEIKKNEMYLYHVGNTNTKYNRWISITGSKFQTNIIVGIYNVVSHKRFVSGIMKNIVSSVLITKDPL